MSSGFSLSYLSRALTSMLLFAGGVSVSAQTLYPSSSNLYASSFMDPFGTQGGVLNINVYTPCLANLIVHVHLPQVYDSSEATATLVSPNGDFGPITVSGYSQNTNNVIPTTASISWSNADKTLTFSDFLDGKSSRTFIRNTPVTGAVWTNVNFDIPDGMFGTSAFPMILELLPGGPPGATDLKIQLISDGHFSVEQLNRVCPTLPPTTPPPCPGCVHGDPVFAGFQGQNFQFHGLPDEHFNLVSSPNVTVNSHFVYLASGGKCDYTDTPCWTHPGTYMDVLGFQIADSHIKLVAGTHEAGLRIWADDIELTRGERVTDFNATGMVHFHHSGRVDIQTELMNFKIVNSDMFMNIQVSLNEPQLLRVGSAKHTITDKVMCKANSETSHHQLVESIVAAKYPVTTPLHGLIGQTWRNVKVCGNDWMGTTEDYLVSELFANDNHYNYFTW